MGRSTRTPLIEAVNLKHKVTIFFTHATLQRKFFLEGLDGLEDAPHDEVMDFYAAVQKLYKVIEEIRYQRYARPHGLVSTVRSLSNSGNTLGVITRFGCASCPFTFCPIGKLGKLLWGDLR